MFLDPLLSAPPVIQVHAFSATAAFALGAFVLWRRKGSWLHKLMGRTWVGLMVVVALSSFFINEIRLVGPFSPIHLLSAFTLVSLVQAIWYIRHGNVIAHRYTMQALYLGSLILAGAFTLLPGRRMHEVLFGAEAGWPPSLIAIGVILAAAVFLWLRLQPTRSQLKT